MAERSLHAVDTVQIAGREGQIRHVEHGHSDGKQERTRRLLIANKINNDPIEDKASENFEQLEERIQTNFKNRIGHFDSLGRHRQRRACHRP